MKMTLLEGTETSYNKSKLLAPANNKEDAVVVQRHFKFIK
jgi:hypothetical protein